MQNTVYECKQNGEDFFLSLSVTCSRFGNCPANGLVTEQPQYSVAVCIFSTLQNTEISLIPNGLRLIFTCSLSLALPCIFHCGKHTSAVLLWSFFIRCHFFFHFQIRSSRCFLYSSLILSLCCSRCWRSTVSTYPPTEISPPAMSFTILRILPWTSRLI